MTRSDFSQPSQSRSGESTGIDQVAFAQLYDRYAPVLLGIITAIVRNEPEATRLLEDTFVKICSQFGEFRTECQPLFVWLVSIARSTALDAVESQQKLNPPVLKLADTGKVVTGVFTRSNSSTPTTNPHQLTASPLNELLDAVFFRNYTLEEAASSIGLPVVTARQQLRLAMQSLREPGSV